jgi:hypothetical protein
MTVHPAAPAPIGSRLFVKAKQRVVKATHGKPPHRKTTHVRHAKASKHRRHR